jgi:hypothetical protein
MEPSSSPRAAYAGSCEDYALVLMGCFRKSRDIRAGWSDSLAMELVTVIGFPLAIFVFAYEQRRERENEDESVYQLLSDNYERFLQTALQHPDLKLFAAEETPQLSE